MNNQIKDVCIEADGDNVKCSCVTVKNNVDRIRRITGYLAKNTDTWKESKGTCK